ncbi:MAG: 5-formyltetrahydrofolate cyclo-ligase [Verrucomicrobia subdivision 3 bacterium]|nr:5-formyltetrahydrofolate cyclo-ligase [Limisphaerales bacterium]
MSAETAAAKAKLRDQLQGEVERHTLAELANDSEAICRRIAEQTLWRKAGCVLFFMPLAGEPDLRPLMISALAEDKTVGLPRYSAQAGEYVVCQIRCPDELLAGKYGVLEPALDCPEIELNKLDFALVPGIGFTLEGCRLGRGKGYFDRLLSQMRAWKCGAAFDWQVTAGIPAEKHDIRVDSIVTPTRWHVVGQER